MVAWKKTLTIPSHWKMDHRYGLKCSLSFARFEIMRKIQWVKIILLIRNTQPRRCGRFFESLHFCYRGSLLPPLSSSSWCLRFIQIYISIISACDEGPGLCALLITLLSCLLIIVSLPLSLCCVIKVVQVCARITIIFHHRYVSLLRKI